MSIRPCVVRFDYIYTYVQEYIFKFTKIMIVLVSNSEVRGNDEDHLPRT